MNYEKKYKDALEKARQLCIYPTTKPFTSDLQDLFPELKESEDERIRKIVYGWINTQPSSFFDLNRLSKEEMLAWLEKQGEKSTLNEEDEKIKEEIINFFECQSKEEPTRKDIHNKWIAWLKKQDEPKQDPCENCNDMCLNCQNFPCVEKREFERGKSVREIIKEEKIDNANKVVVEPKFKVGDWITDGEKVWKIGYIEDDTYIEHRGLISAGGFIESIDKHYHLWSIKDAKDGDVLAVTMYPEGTWIGIFKEQNGCTFSSYCFVNTKGIFKRGTHGHGNGKAIHPATKEQRDILFDKMKEAGYTFNFEKKELKKIVVPIFNIGDTIIKKHNSNIQDFGSFTITDITGGKYWYNDRIICDISEQDEWELYEPVKQNPATWSEEDEEMLEDVRNNFEYNKREMTDSLIAQYDKFFEKIKFLKSQPKQKWSEEDKEKLDRIISIIHCYTGTVQEENELNSWLKSLKDKCIWKPSEKQIKALKEACDEHWEPDGLNLLYTLYQDLKKL